MAIATSRGRGPPKRSIARPAGMSESDDDCDEMGNTIRRNYRGNLTNSAPIQVNYQDLIFKECTNGNLDGVKAAFAEGVNIDQIHYNGFNVLMNACNLGFAHIVEFLLENGANPNFRNSDLFTPFMVLCFSFCDNQSDLEKCAKILISKDANVNVADSHGNTPLMYACKNGHVGVVRQLIAAQVNLNEKDSQGWTALFWAVYKANLPVVKLLVDAGARKKKKDHRGRIAYSLASGRTALKEIADLIRPKHYADDYDTAVELNCNEEEEEDARAEVEALYKNLMVINNTDNQVAERNLVKGQQVDLFTFLTITDEELQTLGMQHRWQRRQTLEFVKKYHLQPWTRLGNIGRTLNQGQHAQNNPEIIRDRCLTFSNVTSIILDLENRLTVMEASTVALLRQWQTNSMPKPEDYGNLPQLIKVSSTEAKFIAVEFATLMDYIRRMEKKINIPCDTTIQKKSGTFPSPSHIIVGSSICLLFVWGVKKVYH